MRFFLYEIVARAVAIYLCVDCCRRLRQGLAERKIAYYSGGDVLDWLFFDWSNRLAHRDATPVQYWIQIGLQATALAGCLGVAIFGWFQPNS
jgi:hypothetical protein